MMNSFFTYTLGVSVTLLILWISYCIALRGEKKFKTNRTVILSIYAASLLTFPLLNLLKRTASISVYPIHSSPIVINYDTLHSIADTVSRLANIWAAGTLIALTIVFVEALKIFMLIRRSEKIRMQGTTVYLTDSERISPFSIGKIIVMSRKDFENNHEMIMAHEKGHIVHYHSLDMLLAQFFTIICWYNPAAWLIRSELKIIHEFQADSYTLRNGMNAYDYQMFLISYAAESKFPAIANGLNRSSLKKRLQMMQRQSNKKYRKILYAIPAIGLLAAIAALSVPQIRMIINSDRIVSSEENMPSVYIDNNEIPKDRLNEISPGDIKSITINKQADRIDIETR